MTERFGGGAVAVEHGVRMNNSIFKAGPTRPANPDETQSRRHPYRSSPAFPGAHSSEITIKSARPYTPTAYIRFQMFAVSGYLKLLDARIITSLLSFQDNSDISGNLCEIGVHHGQLFFILALARRTEERSLAIDLFEDDAINASSHRHRGRDQAMLVNARRLGIFLDEPEIYKTSSLEIGASDILARTGGPIRFFSIDGGHNYKHLENDLMLAKNTLSADGIIAVDDFFNHDWPEVTFATYEFLQQVQRHHSIRAVVRQNIFGAIPYGIDLPTCGSQGEPERTRPDGAVPRSRRVLPALLVAETGLGPRL